MFASALGNSARTVEVGTTDNNSSIDGDQIYALTGGILNSASCVMVPQIREDVDLEAAQRAYDVYSLLTGSTIQDAAESLRLQN